MKKLLLAVGLLSIAGTTLAAGKPCEELEAEIRAKLDAKPVHGYALSIADKGTGQNDGKVVGTCEGGTKEIVYKRK
ncbi:DUF1161 domain-containing protein [Pseudomonas gingeri]|uniref:DUF1161 domain-containing protein n=1 Tax=Pseudomonas gingeri TaxID=117681 RepID=A0A7Y8CL67_9PSED|nr:DUF1161 domain-containing protein [Pseudomonas gingeri]NWA04024.1 DUF1161 domain-containing protein [Pseudomonas gingeri]NWA15868.1 DUF1161 domain-containing protein [Pseudomonas gingeri]NWA55979.1 DUF1161 domain-containing protein [Pseudomonas gingeri]NWA95962.1 DUF1161 domain-containing protein [Pseudomonas gingeri]NWB00365.1 DUF1161 domain-containing protein [Pseudomonas gingeri]